MDRKAYPSDVSDEEWAFVAPYLTLMTEEAPQRIHDLRAAFDGLRWMARTGAVLATPFIRANLSRELAVLHSTNTSKSTKLLSVNSHIENSMSSPAPCVLTETRALRAGIISLSIQTRDRKGTGASQPIVENGSAMAWCDHWWRSGLGWPRPR